MSVQGYTAPGFQTVRALFQTRFDRDEEAVGASFAVYWKGKKVVSLWCGHKDDDKEVLWQEDTLANVFSGTKGMTSLALAHLVGEGEVAYGDKVSKYWPEFGCHGKIDCTIAHISSHQSGLCATEAPCEIEDFLVEGKVANMLALQKPFWTPGIKQGYHAQTMGFLLAELIKRVTGLTLGEYFKKNISQKFDIDFHIGLPEKDESRVSYIEFIMPEISDEELARQAEMAESGSTMTFLQSDLQQKVFEPSPFMVINDRKWRAAELGSINGQTNALAFARIYGGLATPNCELEGRQIIHPKVLAQALEIPKKDEVDAILGLPMAWRQGGFMGNRDDTGHFGKDRENAFGHAGLGGSFGFADPEKQLGIGYVRGGPVVEMHTQRHMELIEVVYACVLSQASNISKL